MHRVDTYFANKKIKIESTHPGLMVADANGNIQVYDEQDEIVFRQGKPVYIFDAPPLCFLNKNSDDTYTAKFGHASGEHQSHAAIVNIEFGSSKGSNINNRYAPIEMQGSIDKSVHLSYLRCGLQDLFELDATVKPSDSSPSGNREGNIDIGEARFLILKPQRNNDPFGASSNPSQQVSITINAVKHMDGSIQTEDEMNCHVAIISENQNNQIARVGLLDPESTLQRGGTEGDSLKVEFDLLSGNQSPYCVVMPFIKPKTTVHFEIGDPEPNAKIIIDDA